MTGPTRPVSPPEPLDLDLIERLAKAATPGPYELVWPDHQGGSFTVWGKQGTPPDFTDGWAIPIVASGVDSNMAYITALHPGIVLELVALARAARPQDETGLRAVDMTSAGNWSNVRVTRTPDRGAEERLRAALDTMADEVREGTRTLSDFYYEDAVTAGRARKAIDRIHLAVAAFANEVLFLSGGSVDEAPQAIDWHQVADDIEGAAFDVLTHSPALSRALHRRVGHIRAARLAPQGGSERSGG